VQKRLLLVEDEAGLVLTLSDRFQMEGYMVEAAPDGNTGLELALTGGFDLILLDVMLPGKSGYDVCRDVRARGIETPILMLTARGQVVDKVVGLKLGADDYITKPFEVIELLARMEALLRRAPNAVKPANNYQFGEVRVDFRKAEVIKAGAPVVLSAREFTLLHYLIDNRGATISREELLNQVWGHQSIPTTRTVDVHVAWLRQKLEENPKYPQFILTIRGIGYKFAG
jgi:two-component system, OmpR family, alkaline phosphatase synthesis response regulator PhoP